MSFYPPGWPRCACGDYVLDGHETCGRVECGTQADAEARRHEADRRCPDCQNWLDRYGRCLQCAEPAGEL